MHFLLTNDDGIQAPGLAALERAIGAIPGSALTVVAPATEQSQCGHRVTTRETLLVRQLAPAPDDDIVLKPRHSAFFGTALETLLDDQKIDTLVVLGISAESCVWMTACDAHTRGFRLVVPADTMAGASNRALRATLTGLEEVLGARVPAQARSLRFTSGKLR